MEGFINSDISTIETKVSEETALRSEGLVDDGAVMSIRKSSKNTWMATVVDNGIHFTVNVQILSDQIKDYTCNCNTTPIDGMCSHIVASVIKIRSKIDDEEKRASANKYKKKRVKRTDISKLIMEIPPKELENFVISRSKSDNNFRLLVQAYFIEHLPKDRIERFIESTFPVLTKANEKVSPSKLNIYLELSKELKAYFKSLLSQENLTEGFRLAYLHLKKSFYIKHHLRNEHSRFLNLHNDLIANFLEIYNLIEAPEYKETILEQLEDLLSSSYISASLSNERKIWMLLINDEINEKNEKKDYCFVPAIFGKSSASRLWLLLLHKDA